MGAPGGFFNSMAVDENPELAANHWNLNWFHQAAV